MCSFNADQTQDKNMRGPSDLPIKEVFMAIWYGRSQPFYFTMLSLDLVRK